MSKLLIETQVYENYAWDADGNLGTGENAYWKAKGGNEYFIEGVDELDPLGAIVDRVRDEIESDNDAFREHITGWEVVADDYMTEFERSQLEYDGKIVFPAKVLVVA